MDTKKLLDEVAKQRTESASLRELVKANNKALQDASAQNQDMVQQIAGLQAKLADALNGEAGQLRQQLLDAQSQVKDLQDAAQQAQNDIDQAVTDLSADNEETQQALEANVPPTSGAGAQGQQSASGAGSAGSSSSSSSSTASGGGDVKKPDPLPGTGAAPTPDTTGSDQSQSGAPPADQSGAGGQVAPVDTPALSGGIADPAKPGSMPPPEDADAAGQTGRLLGSDPNASQAPKSGA